MAERDYAAKRRFAETPEPEGAVEGNVDPARAAPGKRFVIQQHHATRLHFDLRLEMMNGARPVLVSWAVPKNLPLEKGKSHLAVHVEDHPVEYATFSGTIPKGNYGAGEVRIFDRGTYELLEQETGKLTFRLKGDRMRGTWHMILPREKEKDWMVFLREDERPERDPLPEMTPMLATLEREPFDDDRYLFEMKWDGVRALAACTTETLLLSRNGRDITSTYPELASLHDRVVALEAVLDGEIVALEGGRPSFERLQSRINLQDAKEIERATRSTPVSFVAFDLLYLDGRSLVERPVEERKRLLAEIVVPSDRVAVSEGEVGAGRALFEVARQAQLEGIVAKRLGSPYRPGRRSREWLKIKTVRDADLVVGGWTRGEGSRSSSFGSLLMGAYDGDDLRFVGAVGTGFNERLLADLMARLDELETETPAFADPSGITGGRFGKPIKNPRWVTPDLVARVEFREVTSGTRLRAPSFKGLVEDGDPRACTIDQLAAGAG
ncbi:MAG TPA: non-homologous end-joining DNA ligase [Actinomycetota bacterium]|nr:non-homologous end-joining DNA ligase [Actinomycetota bacterium]